MRTARAATWLLVVAALAPCRAGRADSGLLFSDGTGGVDRAAVERAAEPLLARGATVVVRVEPEGDRGPRFVRHLDEAGLLRGGEIHPSAVGLYVSYSPRYSELRVGERFSRSVPPRALEAIRQDLNEALRRGAPAAGLAAALGAIEERIGHRWWKAVTPRAAAIGVALCAAAAVPLAVVLRARRRRRRAWDREQYEKQIGRLRESLLGELETLAGRAGSALSGVRKEERRAALRARLLDLRKALDALAQQTVTPEGYQAFLAQTKDLSARYRQVLAELPAPGKGAAPPASAAVGTASGPAEAPDHSSGSESSSSPSDSSSFDSGGGGESRANGDW